MVELQSKPAKPVERPWILRHAATGSVVVFFAGCWLYANYSGCPGLPRFNEASPPTGAVVQEHSVYGWPVATREVLVLEAPGGGLSRTTRSSDDGFFINAALGIIMVLLAVFLVDWMRALLERAALASLPMTEAQQQRLEKLRREFRTRWFWVLRILLAISIAVIGIFILYVGFGVMHTRDDFSMYADVTAIVHRKGENSCSFRHHVEDSPEELAIGMLMGSILLLCALLLVVRRYRLWMALLAVFIVGMLGSLPFLFGPTGMPTTSLVSFGFESSLTELQLETIRNVLEPATLQKTLPGSMRKELPPGLGLLEVLVEGSATDGGVGVQVVLEFDPKIDGHTRTAVFSVYYEYLYQVSLRVSKALGTGGLGLNRVGLDNRNWLEFRKDWVEARQPELDALFQP